MDKQYFQQVCLNGHQITDYSDTPNNPETFCEKCGSEVITNCPHCETPIVGHYKVQGVIVLSRSKTSVPSYCTNCSEPFPWTEKILNSAVELVSLDENLDDETKQLIKHAIPDLLVDVPTTPIAVAKYKMGISKATTIVKDGLYNLLVDVMSETAKKTFTS
ncbi:DUF2321 domain-containing protein [Listeria booriae]|uniref:DUF2321 domain-containing protein n=1 Tax=Listeria booriae TaxID=1552123 RepID=UPI0016286D48|nr:DUF2321 domain-containing protein [Listeria booriae]MBC2368132.1 DUF2321 domain-containing protein [Listeria booriae]